MATACSSAQESAVDCLGRRCRSPNSTVPPTSTWTAPATRSDGSPFDDLSGYRIYYGIEPNKLSCKIETGRRESSRMEHVTELPPGNWYFAVVSVDGAGVESELSGIVSKQID